MNIRIKHLLVGAALGAFVAGPAMAAKLEFKDPVGDDNGPGTYLYPTDAVYSPGSFDITEVSITNKGKNMDVKVCVNSKLDDPWGMGVGFAVQMAFVFIDTDRAAGSGNTEGLPGTNIRFAPNDGWERVIVLSPQQQSRVASEAKMKAANQLSKGALLIPRKTLGKGKCISGRVKLADVAPAAADAMNPGGWGYQVVMQSNEGFPGDTDLLTRKVNEYEGQHRFGGGTDYDCDPHAMDILGDHAQLAYECKPDGTAEKMAVLSMIRQ